MKFKTTTTRGHGRGKTLGFPTVNMVIPTTLPLQLQQGVYAARAKIGEEKYGGALYYGPAVTFGETQPALEIYLLNTSAFYAGPGEEIEVEVSKFIRPVMEFSSPELLVHQMGEDERTIRTVLKI